MAHVSRDSHMPRKSARCRWDCREVSETPFSAQPSAVGDARALLGSYPSSVCSFSVSLPHTTHAAANGSPSTEKGFSMMHVCQDTHNTYRPLSYTSELNVLFKHSLATRVVQSCAGAGAAQGKETGEWASSRDSRAAGGTEGDLAGSAAVSLTQAAPVFQSRKVKGEDDSRTALLCPWLCPPGLESPGNRRKAFRCIPRVFFSGESQSWWWESKCHWELKPFLQTQIDLVCSSG